MPVNIGFVSSAGWLRSTVGLVVLAVAMTGCGSVRKTFTGDGREGYAITCGSWRGCLVKAGRLCGIRGYDVTYHDEISALLVVSCHVGDQRLGDVQHPERVQ